MHVHVCIINFLSKLRFEQERIMRVSAVRRQERDTPMHYFEKIMVGYWQPLDSVRGRDHFSPIIIL